MGGVKTISIIVAANIKGLEVGLGKANKSIAKEQGIFIKEVFC